MSVALMEQDYVDINDRLESPGNKATKAQIVHTGTQDRSITTLMAGKSARNTTTVYAQRSELPETQETRNPDDKTILRKRMA